MKSFLKYSLPWILAAALLIAVPVAIMKSDMGFEKITFSRAEETPTATEQGVFLFVLNEQTRKIHLPDCRYATALSAEKRKEISTNDPNGLIEELEKEGYSPCKTCIKKDR